MSADTRVCPFCGEPPGTGVFCEACGRNLGGVDRLPTRAEWEVNAEISESSETIADRAAAATESFLTAMRAAGSPGKVKLPSGKAKAFGRTPTLEGWIVRPVERDEERLSDGPYEPGLFLDVEGEWHRLDNQVRGWGQRDFPQFHHTVEADALAAPADARVVGELAAVLGEHGVGVQGRNPRPDLRGA
jgi:hypothetical protein